ncbi:MAG: hypothetical protein LH472_12940 [Pyrinomonadaceae bacterium]|nr:hypothetical protein [Pyrinomonadaceae bacterium]
MSNVEIETRISALEKELNTLKSKFEKIEKKEEPWWKQIIGTFANDPAHEEAMRLGREYRLSQREDYDKD